MMERKNLMILVAGIVGGIAILAALFWLLPAKGDGRAPMPVAEIQNTPVSDNSETPEYTGQAVIRYVTELDDTDVETKTVPLEMQ